MLTASRRAGYSDDELVAAGLARSSHSRPGQFYDFFRRQIMFPTADARGRVRGFGARAMGESRGPKYVNTPDGDLYHKREVLYGVELARASAAKLGRIVLVEGYTDVIAMHQAGITNVVGIMGTSLTEQQIRELQRICEVLELCLDADPAGVKAMLRAAQLAADSKLELRVVRMPAGADPAELIASEGPEGMRERVTASVPFVTFAVEGIIEHASLSSAEGKDRAIAELRPLLAPLRPSVLRDELTRTVAGALELSETRLSGLLASADGASGVGAPRVAGAPRPVAPAAVGSGIDQSLRWERSFLALCLVLPEEGAEALASIDPDELLTSEPLRRAARHLRGRTDAPLSDLPGDDEGLAQLIADLVGRAGERPAPVPAALAHAKLVLELARVDRALARARAQRAPGITLLARERQQTLEALHALGGALDTPL
jgi:DNA primase